ncbi:MAG: polyamine aminopropyltransferase [Calditrichia bacterium]
MSHSVISNKPAEQLENSVVTTKSPRSKNFVLKACIFATGLAGIVAEYVISTLASYLLGNTVLQWTLILSLMLFAMGIGSRLSRYFKKDLLDTFIFIEFGLSVLCAVSALFSYFLSAYIQNVTLVIYPLATAIGVLIGLEIPLATRLNDYFEELRINISAVMEKDYYGALLGGLLFAFVALPYLGLTYTPIILGTVNFLVASVLFLQFRKVVRFKKILTAALITVPVILGILAYTAEPIVLYGEQQKYKDRVIFQQQTPYQRIVVTQWKDYYWLYLNGNEQFSSYDEERYHEPLVHPAMMLASSKKNVLVLGGGDGLAVREILKYPAVESVTLVDIDPAMTKLGMKHPLFVTLNGNSLNDARVQVVNRDAYIFLRDDTSIYDVIIVDLPDPKSVEIARLYTRQFYKTAVRHLSRGGVIVTQATSPFFSKKAFLSILKTMRAAGMPAIAYHNNIPTLGEWGWVLAMNSRQVDEADLKEALSKMNFEGLETRFLNRDAMISMLHFGKNVFKNIDEIKVNDELDLALFHYYDKGSWDLY